MSTFKSIRDLTEKSMTVSRTYYDIGLQEFNRLKVDFTPGQVVLVGSRPSIGKNG